MIIGNRHRPDFRLTWRHAACAMAVAHFLCAGGVLAATLSTSHSTNSGGLIAVTVLLRPGAGESIAGAQFNVQIDLGRYEVHEVITGDAAASAGKEVAVGAHGDALTILVAGFNQHAMSEGALATIYLAPVGEPSAAWPSIEAAVLSDPFGKQVPVTVAPEPKTVDPPADETESSRSQPAPAQPESKLPASANTIESGTRTNARGWGGGLAESENDASSEPVFVPPPFGTGRKVSASPMVYAPSVTDRSKPDAPATVAGGRAAAVPTPESPAAVKESTAGGSPASHESARRVKLTRAMPPLATGGPSATGASLPLSRDEGTGSALGVVLQPKWKNPAVFVASLVVIFGVFSLRRRLFGKGRF